MHSVSFRAGDVILAEGTAGDTAYLIVSGSVEVTVGKGARARQLGTLGAGDVFGEMSLIEPGPRSATVRAATDADAGRRASTSSSPPPSPTPSRRRG